MYSSDLINFVAGLTYGADLAPITLEDAAYDIECWKEEDLLEDMPADLTPESYCELWNKFCEEV